MDVSTSFVADNETAHLVEPGEGMLHHAAMLAQALARFDPRAGDAALDPPISQQLLIPARAVAFVGVEFSRALSRMPHLSSDRRNGIEQKSKETRLMDVGWRDQLGEGNALGIDHKMALRARFAAIRRIRAGVRSPFFAGTVEAPAEARLQLGLVCIAELVEQLVLEPLPEARGLPVAQAPPAGHAEATAQLPGQHGPGDARAQHKDDSGQTWTIRHARSAALRLRSLLGE